MVRHTLKILQQMLQDFLSTSDYFRTLGINGLFFFYSIYQAVSQLDVSIKR